MLDSILKKLSIIALNQMQEVALNTIQNNAEVLLLSPTGSGKTLAYVLPVLQNLQTNHHTEVLIIVPSRELAIQIAEVIKKANSSFKTSVLYGGNPVKTEKNNLVESPKIIIATPGRLNYHLRNQHINCATIHTLILDEFDKSLELGFHDEMALIFQQLDSLKNKILTSATALKEYPNFLNFKELKTINFLDKNVIQPKHTIKMVKCEGMDKISKLVQILSNIQQQPVMVFCNFRHTVEEISEYLKQLHIIHGVYHGGLLQQDREKALIKFRNGSYQILITTDLASRGLDIPDTAFVVHFQLPHTLDAYIHRNGRTARMNAEGTTYLLMNDTDFLPAFITDDIETENISDNRNFATKPNFKTIFVGAGKKDKINKIDIVGFFIQKGSLNKEDIGLIHVRDKMTYVAVKRDKIQTLIKNLFQQKLKGKNIKIVEDAD